MYATVGGSYGINKLALFYNDYSAVWTGLLAVTQHTTEQKIQYQGTAAWAAVAGGASLNAGDRIELCVFRDNLLIGNGTSFETWSGTGNKSAVTYAAGSVSVVPKLMAISDDKLFAVDPDYPNTVFFTIEGAWTTDPATDIEFKVGHDFDIPNQNSDKNGIIAIFRHKAYDDLLIFRNNGVYRLVGEDYIDYQMQQIQGVGGAVSPDAICETDDGVVVFVGVNNIYAYDGQGIKKIGEKIRPAIKGVNMTNATAVYDPRINSVLIGYRGGTLIWNAKTGGWSEWDIPMRAAARFTAPESYNKIVFAFDDSPNVYDLDEGLNDDGSDISWQIQIGLTHMGVFAESKHFRKIQVLTKTKEQEPFDVTLYTDDGKTLAKRTARVKKPGNVWGASTWSGTTWAGSGTKAAIVNIPPMDGKLFHMKIEETSQVACSVYGIGVAVDELDRLDGDQ